MICQSNFPTPPLLITCITLYTTCLRLMPVVSLNISNLIELGTNSIVYHDCGKRNSIFCNSGDYRLALRQITSSIQYVALEFEVEVWQDQVVFLFN